MRDILRDLPIQVLYVLVSIIWGIAKNLHEYQTTGKFRFGFFLAGCCISAFTGFMFASFATLIGVGDEARMLFAGMGGYMGTRSIDFIEQWIKQKTLDKINSTPAHLKSKKDSE